MKHINPFVGKPSPIDLTAFAHFPPDVYLQLRQLPTGRSAFIEAGAESLFKRLQRGAKTGRISQRTMAELLALNPDGETRFSQSIQKAFEGDSNAIATLEEMGQWGAFLSGISPKPEDERSCPEKYLLALEKLSYSFIKSWQAEDYDDALSALRESQLAIQIFGEDGISAIKHGRDINALLCIRAAAAMETYLGLMAVFILEVESQSPNGMQWLAEFRALLPDPKQPETTPSQRLMQQLYSTSKVTSWAKLAERVTRSGALSKGSDVAAMLKRWRSGKYLPERHHFELVCKGAGSSKQKLLSQLHAFSIHLNFLGWFEETMRRKVQPLI